MPGDSSIRAGDRVRSVSDGFTGGLTGTVNEISHRYSEPMAFVQFDNGLGVQAVAVRLLVVVEGSDRDA